MECKHGLALGTCAYCSGLVRVPSSSTGLDGAHPVQFVGDVSPVRRWRAAMASTWIDENPDKAWRYERN
jgi:hypothetical protein